MNSSPRISVVMAAYNEKIDYIRQAIDSILKQTYDDFELIIVLDNPDNDVLNDYIRVRANEDDRIILIYNGTNMGLAKSLNRGLQVAQGEYVARMDADDISMPNRFEIQIDYMEQHPECGLVCGRTEYIDGKGNKTGVITPYYANVYAINRMLEVGCVFTHPGIMVRRNSYEEVGGYHAFVSAQDYDLYLRMKEKGIIMAMVPEILVQYRVNPDGISQKNRLRQVLCARYARYIHCKNIGFTEKGCEKFFKRNGLYSQKKIKRFGEALDYLNQKNKSMIIIYMIIDKNFRREVINILKMKKLQKEYN